MDHKNSPVQDEAILHTKKGLIYLLSQLLLRFA